MLLLIQDLIFSVQLMNLQTAVPYIRSSSADMDLRVIGIRVRLQTFVLDNVQQLRRVEQEQ